MKIEVWSDFTCPYCYLGKRRLEIALVNTGCQDVVELEFKSFELDSKIGTKSDMSKLNMLMQKFGLSREKVKEMAANLSIEAEKVGIKIELDNLQHTNTFHAHRLAKFAIKKHPSKAVVEQLFKTYFSQRLNIGEKEVLVDLAVTLGIEKAEVDELLCLNKFARHVKEDIDLADELGISSVPFYIFDETYAIEGLQTVETFEEILHTLCYETNLKKQLASKTTYCEGQHCSKV